MKDLDIGIIPEVHLNGIVTTIVTIVMILISIIVEVVMMIILTDI